MNDFDYENLQKKRIASGAYHRKNGSKSHACTLPSDHLSEAERRKLNGPVVTLRLDEPMEYKAFKRLSDEQKKMYLARLEELYHPSQQMLGDMFGVSAAAVCKALKKLGVRTSYGQKDGRRPTGEQYAMWEAFLGGVVGGKPGAPKEGTVGLDGGAEAPNGSTTTDDVVLQPDPQEVEDLLTSGKAPTPEEPAPSRLTHLDITFENVHSWEELYALLQRIGLPDEPVGIRVIVE